MSRSAMPAIAAACLAALSAPGAARADAPQEAPSPKCAAPEHHAFDFQLGHWRLTDPDGQPAGVIRNTAILGGCAIAEEYVDEASGSRGVSTSAYDPAVKAWRQYWASNGGWTLLLEGGHREGDRFVMTGTMPGRDTGKPQQQRATWFIGDDGKVKRQLWEQSDDGVHWKTHFDATYRALP